MILTLEVTGAQAGPLGPSARKVFAASGGSIGRLASNQWVLQHPYVSGRHALIRYERNTFTIEDTKSANGVFINSLEHRLPLGERYPLKDGDTIFIDPFEIHVSLASEARETPAAAVDDPFSFDDLFAPSAPASDPAPLTPAQPIAQDPFAAEEVDPLNLLGIEGQSAPPTSSPRRAADLQGGSRMSDHYRPPPAPAPPPAQKTPPSSSLIPDDYNPLLADDQQPSRSDSRSTQPGLPPPTKPSPRSTRTGSFPAPPLESGSHAKPPRPRPAPPARPDPAARSADSAAAPPPSGGAVMARPETPAARRQGSDLDLSSVLAGAGLDPAAVTPELARSFGEILRVVVSGVMDVLQTRTKIKDEFGMRMTTFRPADNNPLKFSANVDDALHNLLVKRNAAYLGPVEAFEDAFGDVRNHQMAMLAGMRMAYEAMLAEFDPERLQEGFDRQSKKGSLLAVPAKLRYWDLYREKFGDMVRDAEATFAELFGDEFARAYEQQLEQLRAQGRSNKR